MIHLASYSDDVQISAQLHNDVMRGQQILLESTIEAERLQLMAVTNGVNRLQKQLTFDLQRVATMHHYFKATLRRSRPGEIYAGRVLSWVLDVEVRAECVEMVQMWSGWALGWGPLLMGMDVSLFDVRDKDLMPKR